MPYKNIEDKRRYDRNVVKKRHENPELRKKYNETNNIYVKRRYATDPEYRERVLERHRKRRAADPEYQERHKKEQRKRHAFIKLHFPWLLHWNQAHRRCADPNKSNYKYYGGKGVRMLLTKEETRRLYIRDRAWELKQPTIDRIDPNDDYCLDNCRFIEQSDNSRRKAK